MTITLDLDDFPYLNGSITLDLGDLREDDRSRARGLRVETPGGTKTPGEALDYALETGQLEGVQHILRTLEGELADLDLREIAYDPDVSEAEVAMGLCSDCGEREAIVYQDDAGQFCAECVSTAVEEFDDPA